jgi:aryl-alcohol dehydrogenase-like predicted oxidoreductase
MITDSCNEGSMQNPVEQRALGPCLASAIGLGCMNLSHAYGVPPPPAAAADLLLRALDLGVTHFDTAALYGFGANEELVGRTLTDRRSQITLASKCGMQGVKFETGLRRVIDGRPETLRQTCEASLRRLRTDMTDVAAFSPTDIRRAMPRFSSDHHAANLELLTDYAALARDAGCSMAQLALAWVLTRGPHVLAIPGTTNIAHLEENMAGGRVRLTEDVCTRLDALINRGSIRGARYNAATQAEIDTEDFA